MGWASLTYVNNGHDEINILRDTNQRGILVKDINEIFKVE